MNPPPFLLRLMLRDKIPMKWGKKLVELKPEEKVSVDTADKLRIHSLDGSYKGIWIHVPNEGKRSILVAIILKAMGLIPGANDFIFIWPANGFLDAGIIELKSDDKKKLTPNQIDFQEWALSAKIKTAKHSTADGVINQLKEWGAIA